MYTTKFWGLLTLGIKVYVCMCSGISQDKIKPTKKI